MKYLKLLKYAFGFVLFVVLTSFKPADKFATLQGGDSQLELNVIND